MSDKRRGLGRGLGALIPSTAPPTRPAGERPVDVFFPGRPDADAPADEGAAAPGAHEGPRPGAHARARSDAPARPIPPQAPERAGDRVHDGGSPVQDHTAQVSPEPGPASESTGPHIGDAAARPGASDGSDTARRVAAAANAPAVDASVGQEGLVPVPGAHFAEILIDAIRPNPRQPRVVFDEEALAELVHSIREIGVLQPVVVRPIQDEDGERRYELIMGERRWRATREAGLDLIPAIVRETSDDDLLRDALLENLHRSDLNALEEAAAYQQLLDDFGCTHEELATRIGRSRPQISNTLRLLKLPPLVQRRVAAGVLSAGHARALLGLEDSGSMERLAQRIVSEGLSVRAVEEIVSLGDGPVPKQAKRRPRAGSNTGELDELASRLGDRLDTRVTVALGRSRGRLSIDFASVEDLNRIMGLLAPDVRKAFTDE